MKITKNKVKRQYERERKAKEVVSLTSLLVKHHRLVFRFLTNNNQLLYQSFKINQIFCSILK